MYKVLEFLLNLLAKNAEIYMCVKKGILGKVIQWHWAITEQDIASTF